MKKKVMGRCAQAYLMRQHGCFTYSEIGKRMGVGPTRAKQLSDKGRRLAISLLRKVINEGNEDNGN